MSSSCASFLRLIVAAVVVVVVALVVAVVVAVIEISLHNSPERVAMVTYNLFFLTLCFIVNNT